MKKERKKKMPDKIALLLMQDINKNELKTSAIVEKYKDYDIRPHDVYNIIHKDTYKHLRDFV